MASYSFSMLIKIHFHDILFHFQNFQFQDIQNFQFRNIQNFQFQDIQNFHFHDIKFFKL